MLHEVEVDLPVAVPVAVPVSVKECAVVPTDEKASDVLSKPDPTRVEVMRNGSVVEEPLVVVVSSSPVAPALPYTRRSPLEGESESQFVGCLSDLVEPMTLPVGPLKMKMPDAESPDLMTMPPVAVSHPMTMPVATAAVASESKKLTFDAPPTVRRCVMLADGCSCGNTACDNQPSTVIVESESVCSSYDVKPKPVSTRSTTSKVADAKPSPRRPRHSVVESKSSGRSAFVVSSEIDNSLLGPRNSNGPRGATFRGRARFPKTSPGSCTSRRRSN